MKFIQKHRRKIGWTLLLLLLLGVAFFQGEEIGRPPSVAAPTESPYGMEVQKEAGTEEPEAITPSSLSVAVPTASPQDAEPAKEEKEELPSASPPLVTCPPAPTCTLSVRCNTAVQKGEDMRPDLPKDGVIYAETEVSFTVGESVFDILLREMRARKIHLEFSKVPLYDGVYIEGIQNLYEYDFGELSGWMYKVNGAFPRKSCSEYIVCAGDKIEWVYTCDMGKDVGSIPATET